MITKATITKATKAEIGTVVANKYDPRILFIFTDKDDAYHYYKLISRYHNINNSPLLKISTDVLNDQIEVNEVVIITTLFENEL